MASNMADEHTWFDYNGNYKNKLHTFQLI